MNENIILLSTSKSELKSLVSEAVKEELSAHFNQEKEDNNRLLTRKEVAKILGISLPTLYTWTKLGVIKAIRLGGTTAVRYKKSEVDSILKNIDTIKYSR